MYIANGYWNDENCDDELPYICRKDKQYLPPATTIVPPTDTGCDKGWAAYGTKT